MNNTTGLVLYNLGLFALVGFTIWWTGPLLPLLALFFIMSEDGK